MSYICKKMINRHELDHFKDIFFELNISMTGQLTRKELLECFWKHGHNQMNFFDIDIILAMVDDDNSG